MDIATEQNLLINEENKLMYGEVHTPYILINQMFSLLPEEVFEDPTKRWLDPGAGRGFFSLFLFNKLMTTLSSKILDTKQREEHILTHMIWMIELNKNNVDVIKQSFPSSQKLNLITGDFLSTTVESFHQKAFDIIIGNPPFNVDGLKKVPTNNVREKKKDGKTIWNAFIKHSISLLKKSGKLVFIVPSIWMKEDKQGMYLYMTQYKLHKIHCLTNTEMNTYFNGNAQTPSCFFLLEKKSTDKKVLLHDNDFMHYVDFPLRSENILPVSCSKILTCILPYVDKYGSSAAAGIIKSNLPSKHVKFSNNVSNQFPFANIKTCILKNKVQPTLVIQYSNKECPFYNKTKLVMAHGMYGFPYIDVDGKYGISNRDKYVYMSDNIEDLERLHNFLSTDLVLYLFNATRYRMKFLEKYIFKYLPNILNMTADEVCEMTNAIILPCSLQKYKYVSIIPQP